MSCLFALIFSPEELKFVQIELLYLLFVTYFSQVTSLVTEQSSIPKLVKNDSLIAIFFNFSKIGSISNCCAKFMCDLYIIFTIPEKSIQIS